MARSQPQEKKWEKNDYTEIKNMLPIGQWWNFKGILKYLETNDNEEKNHSNLWDATKSALRGKLIAIQAFLKKEKNLKFPN